MAIQALFLWMGMEFDVQLDRLTYGRRWARKTLALSEIIAVQRIDLTHVEGDRMADRLSQINLVVDDRTGRRINVSFHEDRQWSMKTAREIAAALDVPLIQVKIFSQQVTKQR